jgi:hypothetical protein
MGGAIRPGATLTMGGGPLGRGRPYHTRIFKKPVQYGTRKQRTVHLPYTYIRNLHTVRYGTEGFVHCSLYGSKNVRYVTVRYGTVRYGTVRYDSEM